MLSSQINSTTEVPPTFQFKGGLYPLTAVQLLEPSLSTFEQQLEVKILQAPKFFHYAPVVIDLQKLKPSTSIDFNRLKNILLRKQLIPVGVKGLQPEQHENAIAAGFAILQENNKEKEPNQTKEITKPNASATSNASTTSTEIGSEMQGSNTKIVTEPVRSGQQIYARGGDLIVVGPVSHGAELLADGHIHVYGPLRGRALAGVTGDQAAHIFCQSLEAELISIAGQYKISEDVEQGSWRMAVDISMIGGRLHIQPF